MYSFIKPRSKYGFDSITYIWLAFLVFVSIVLISFGVYINFKNKNFDNYVLDYKNKILLLKREKEETSKRIFRYKEIQKDYLSAKKTNQSIENALKNLFMLIPNQIKINKLYMSENELKIYGTTDSPKTYKLLLEPSLKSIFDESRVGFTKKGDSEYLFSSYNTTKRIKDEK